VISDDENDEMSQDDILKVIQSETSKKEAAALKVQLRGVPEVMGDPGVKMGRPVDVSISSDDSEDIFEDVFNNEDENVDHQAVLEEILKKSTKQRSAISIFF
jgi:hypothetical protein